MFLSSDKGPNFTQGESVTKQIIDPDHATKDLYEAMERGDFQS